MRIVITRQEIVVWAIAALLVAIITAHLIQENSLERDTAQRPHIPGVMEKKFQLLKSDMTKADVEALLGDPTGVMLLGGSKSSSEDYNYIWRGDGGLISILFAKSADDHPIFGPPGIHNRIKSLSWQPGAKKT